MFNKIEKNSSNLKIFYIYFYFILTIISIFLSILVWYLRIFDDWGKQNLWQEFFQDIFNFSKNAILFGCFGFLFGTFSIINLFRSIYFTLKNGKNVENKFRYFLSCLSFCKFNDQKLLLKNQKIKTLKPFVYFIIFVAIFITFGWYFPWYYFLLR